MIQDLNLYLYCHIQEDITMWLGTSLLELRVQADNSILEYNSCTHVVIASRHILASDVQP